MTMKLKAPAIITKAMRTIAASKPTIPRFCFAILINAFFQFIFHLPLVAVFKFIGTYIKYYEMIIWIGKIANFDSK
jgi:hypothetical protein